MVQIDRSQHGEEAYYEDYERWGFLLWLGVENSLNGTIRFTYPGIYSGKEVEDIKLTFKKGKVIKASAAKGDELLREILKIKGANRIGETAIGTNYGIAQFTKEMLFDEKMGGTIHMALGNSYPETGGLNKSAIH